MFDFTKKLSILFLIIITLQSYAQNMAKSELNKNEVTQIYQETTSNNFIKNGKKRNIKGIIEDSATGKPLPGANVMIKGTTIGAATDLNGEFIIYNMPQGPYTLVVKFIGYKEEQKKIELKEKSLYVEISLAYEAVEGEVVEVTAQAKGQMDAINKQINSNTIKNVVSSDRLREIPDANAAESVGRLPGVAIQRSGGEASALIIRGMGEGYTTVSLDEVKMQPIIKGSSDGTSEERSLGIAMISPYMVDGIELTKAVTPDMDGDATAGNIKFKIKQAPSDLRLNVLLQGGYSAYSNMFGMPKINVDLSNRFFNNKLGIYVQGSFYRADRGTDNFSGSYESSPTESDPYPSLKTVSANVSKKLDTRDRYGFNFVIDYNLPNGKLLFKNFASRMYSNSYTRSNSYSVADGAMSSAVSGTQDAISDAVISSLSGEHNVFSGLLDWSVSYSFRNYDKPMQWNLSASMPTSNMDLVELSKNSEKGASVIPNFFNNYNSSDEMEFRYLNYNSVNNYTGNITAQLNMEIPFNVASWFNGKVKLGGKFLQDDRTRFDRGHRCYMGTQDISDISIIQDIKERFPYLKWSEFNRVILTTFLHNKHDTEDVFGDDFDLYFPMDIDMAKKFVNDYKTDSVYGVETLSGRKNNYNNREQYYAGYFMGNINLTRKLTFIPGIRYERMTHEYYDTYDIRLRTAGVPGNTLDDQGILDPVNSHSTRDIWLPMFHLIYNVNDGIKLRAAYTETVKRPSYLYMSPKKYIDFSKNRARLGNPDLKYQEAINYDLQASFYGNYVGLLSIGGFYKKIKNLIYYTNFTALEEDMEKYNLKALGLKDYASIRTYMNVPQYRTWTAGLEIEWQANLWFLPFPLNGLVLNVNYSYIQSETYYRTLKRTISDNPWGDDVIEEEMVETKGKMPGQIDHLANFSLGYDIYGFSIRVTSLYQGPDYGNAQFLVDIKRKEALFRWDIKASQKFTDNLRLNLDFNNVTSWPDLKVNDYYGWIISKQNYYWQGSLGLTYSFQ